MIAEARHPSSSSHHFRLTGHRRRAAAAKLRAAHLPSQIQVPNRHLLPGLVAFLRRADRPGQHTRLIFAGLETVSWEAVCQLYAWAVAKHERGGRLVLQFTTVQGWRTAQRTGLVQEHGLLETVPPPALQSAPTESQDATSDPLAEGDGDSFEGGEEE